MATRDFADIEVRFAPPADDGTVEGIAVRFDVLDSYGTKFASSAFAGWEGRSVPMLWTHGPADVIGSWVIQSISPTEMKVRGKLNLEVQRAREVRAMLAAGDVRGLSIGFTTIKAETRSGARYVTKAVLHEISVVGFPSVPGSRVTTIRSDDRSGAAVRLAQAARAAVRAIAKR